tara:strand:+ start:757 stop:1218 length:462 start_codon:yes stop_codon:yes gene_type:complete
MGYIFFLILVVLWLAFSGVYEPLTLSFGLVSIFIVMVLTSMMKMPLVSTKRFRYDKFFVRYIPWLLKEIVISAIKTSGCVLGIRKFKSNSKRIKSSQSTHLGKVIFANSITLTPGTLTMEIDDNGVIVHALCDDSIKELEAGEMDRRVFDLEQ